MSDLSNALEGLRQAKKQLQWVTFAESALKNLQDAENKYSQLCAESSRLTDVVAELNKSKFAAEKQIAELREVENHAAKSCNSVLDKLALVEASIAEEAAKLTAKTEKAHQELLASLEAEVAEAQKAHDEKLAVLAADIEEALEKKASIQNDIDELTQKWSK